MERFSRPKVDLFASPDNAHLDRFKVCSSGSREYWRASQPLAGRAALRLPNAAPPTEGGKEDSCRVGRGDPGHSTLALTALVCRLGGTFSGQTLEDTAGQSFPHPGVIGPPGSSVAPIDRLAFERRALSRDNYPSEVIDTIQASWRASTNRIYDATWRAFCSWCNKSGLDPTQVAALFSVFSCRGLDSLARHKNIRRFLKGAVNLRPPVVHRFPTWDLVKVLQTLMEDPFEPLRDTPLRYLSFKVSFLVAITSARRISELASLSVRPGLCVFHTNRVVLCLDPSFLPKVNSWFHRAQELVLPNFCPNPVHALEPKWHTLDVRRALRIYIKRTSSFRKMESFFVSFQLASLGPRSSFDPGPLDLGVYCQIL
ncbi:uncharacterized protein LOC117654965 [Pantherophis guttatus]|uniref:Uncharacterized protein LOC117654965 n=1 Tax=Pantherophis guttatus TaxID=94885 RepID=A0A6P9AQA8_PANGU|nr:uncharacterized protein LOC117654965 [Pantherophis guttatus]XP_034257857.1 uncharacterized protein LOC117654965 [Pantherophis guttatus]